MAVYSTVTGGRAVSSPSPARNASAASVIAGVWNAYSSCTTDQNTPRARAAPARSVMAGRGPATTVLRGLFTAAIDTAPPYGAISSAVSRRSSPTTAIMPAPRVSPMAAARSTETAQASSSVRHPAAWAAPISPTLWPITASGRSPQACHTAVSAAWTAKIAGWATTVSSSRDRSRPADSSSRSDQPAIRRTTASQRSMTSSAAGWRARTRPMPGHCEP